MKKTLKELLEDLTLKEDLSDEEESREISALVYDSRKLVSGCLFVCIKGVKFDGHDAIPEAIEKKAAAVLVERITEKRREECLAAGVLPVVCEDTREALALTAAAWFDHPARKMFTVGITGTKGKTTATYLVREALNRCRCKCGLVGTIEIDTGKRKIPSKNTTPESYELQQYMAEMVENGCYAMVMEVSSQGLMMHRTAGIPFYAGVFTNLSEDHIGPNEHKDFEDYLHCKSLLFKQCRIGIYNADDPYAERVMEGNTCEMTLGFGIRTDCEIRALSPEPVRTNGRLGMHFTLEEGGVSYKREIDMPGLFSVYNFLAAYAAASNVLYGYLEWKNQRSKLKMQVNPSGVMDMFEDVPVKGRLEMVPVSEEYTLMIDYAHNAMALESLLTTIKDYDPERIVTLFGCGGNRARARRYEMGEVSGKLSDLTIITSDNPRDEEPMDIIGDILTGIEKTKGRYVTVPDRKEAIAYAIHHARKGDVIILAGKGHEDYQEIRGVKHPMDERRLILEILREDGNTEAYKRVAACYPDLAEE